ncbi:1-phosphofructokinase family hexose kinase [Actinomadura sp. ATCC 31491]|uniref:1-phosphofructokinase family hexose kinase n=1 Tax=Actinomadura luzonensis TaxID=2805427 RepID=A0ABT0FS51_9ACTN|nr:1-phosphofructokinase family hexose kinase [Actinomadura luzonensis]MCK2215164.1 1-phosphofructokinase family hexose kinase [Actinomadura luzonensis]
MILTVTLNMALDVTYEVPAVDWDGVNRVGGVHRRAGGKGVNVARVLAALGQEVLVTGLAGGPTGRAIEADLRAAELPSAVFAIEGDSRTTLAVRETGGAARTALFNEPGPEVAADELAAFTRHYAALAARADVVVLSGSLPRGVPADFYATLSALVPAPVIVDADGDPLRHAPKGRPSVVKPNAEELARAVPGPPDRGAEVLRGEGAESVVVSLGAGGLLAVTGEGTFRARMPYTVRGNPTGAGDSLVAGLALGLVEAAPWPERLRRAAALGAAAVAAPVAGDFDRGVYDDIHPQIVIT